MSKRLKCYICHRLPPTSVVMDSTLVIFSSALVAIFAVVITVMGFGLRTRMMSKVGIQSLKLSTLLAK